VSYAWRGACSMRKPYPSDLTDKQWVLVECRLRAANGRRRRRTVDLREVVNAMAYRRRHGCPWRALPDDLPPWQTVYEYQRAWEKDGTWSMLCELLEQLLPLPGAFQPLMVRGQSDASPVQAD